MTTFSAPAAVSPPKSTAKPGTVCHWLPCNIDYDGMAPVHQYFAPQEVEENVHGAQLRGRGLLSVLPENQEQTMEGAVLSFTNGGKIHSHGSFQEIREWHHEHSIPAAKREQSLVQTAHDWCQVARAVRIHKYVVIFIVVRNSLTHVLLLLFLTQVHDPIPVDEE